MRQEPTYERRGSMVFQEGNGRPGTGKFISEHKTVAEAQAEVDRLNIEGVCPECGLTFAECEASDPALCDRNDYEKAPAL